MDVLVFALWIVSGGGVNSGGLAQPEIKAYFSKVDECQRVGALVAKLTVNDRSGNRPYQCIQAKYWVPVGSK
jgi:hypothetical protein